MFGTDFMYLWTFDTNNGLWLARRPASSSLTIDRNTFDFTSGERLKLTSVKGITYSGHIEGPSPKQVSGGFAQGVLSMHFVDSNSNSDGYAMFIVDPDWQGLHGVWWLNNYTSAPFGGSWETGPAGNQEHSGAGQGGAA
jgi:hypothetical protein